MRAGPAYLGLVTGHPNASAQWPERGQAMRLPLLPLRLSAR